MPASTRSTQISTYANRARATAQTGAVWRIASTPLPIKWGMFEALGFKAHLRDFSLAAAILHDLRIPRVRLPTNNPKKARALRDNGIDVVQRISCEVDLTTHSLAYLQTKKDKMGHALTRLAECRT